jgi:hypothetical protein
MFAASKSASSGALITQTFTSNSTWVAPAGVGLIQSASGNGGTATSFLNIVAGINNYFARRDTGTRPNAPFGQWADLYAEVLNNFALITSNSGTNLLPLTTTTYFVDSSDNWASGTFPDTYWVTGSSGSINAINGPSTSGNMTYAGLVGAGDIGRGWRFNGVNVVLPGQAGSATTAFGNTYPGGTLTGTVPFTTAVAPVTTTFTNVSVTPLVSYSIVVPTGGSLTITYFG